MRVLPVRRRPRRVAMLSVHTSPLHQPGTGDAGGMNVYIVELARRLAAEGTAVEIFTRATSADLPPIVPLTDGVLVRHIPAGPYEGVDKAALAGQLCAFAAGVMRAEAAREPGWYDVIHSHYWLSGQVGWLAAERWGVPLVHTMHTMAKVKNLQLAAGDEPEPRARVIGESQVVAEADRLVANTDAEAGQLVDLYDADPSRVVTVAPGVDLAAFVPGSQWAARARLGVRQDAVLLLFVGRIQPLKAPDVLVEAAAHLLRTDPSLRDRLVVAIVGGPSGRSSGSSPSGSVGTSSGPASATGGPASATGGPASGTCDPESLRALAGSLGVSGHVRFEPPVARDLLPLWYRAADVTVVPSHSESFGLVAVESQACGTPVVASRVGGLTTAVADGVSGLLVPGHDPLRYAEALRGILDSPRRRAELAAGAIRHAGRFGWEHTANAMQAVYTDAITELAAAPLAVNA